MGGASPLPPNPPAGGGEAARGRCGEVAGVAYGDGDGDGDGDGGWMGSWEALLGV
jgi:hypothetical protein